MIYLRPLCDDELRHPVIEVGVVAKAHIALDNGRFGLGSGHHQHPGMGNDVLFAGRNEGDVYGTIRARACRQMYERAVTDECGIERSKAVVFDRSQRADVTPDDLAVFVKRLSQTGYSHSIRFVNIGQVAVEPSVYEHQCVPVVHPRYSAAHVLHACRALWSRK